MSLPELLQTESSLTARQLESLQSYLRIAAGEMRYREAATRGTSKSVTIGAFFRTVQQARDNIRKSIVSLLIGVWIGAIKPEDMRRLLDVTKGDLQALTEEEKSRYIQVLHALLNRIVT